MNSWAYCLTFPDGEEQRKMNASTRFRKFIRGILDNISKE
jgi:hypothetical protein